MQNNSIILLSVIMAIIICNRIVIQYYKNTTIFFNQQFEKHLQFAELTLIYNLQHKYSKGEGESRWYA